MCRLKFLKALLPDPASLGPRTKGKTNIGCIFTGKKDGKDKTYYIYNVCDHEECYKEVGSQAVSYTTGVPAMCGAMMLLTGKWNKPGVYTVEEFDPDPFLDALDKYGLPRSESYAPGAGRLMGVLTKDSRPQFAGLRGKLPQEVFGSLPTPCYILDEVMLKHNGEILAGVAERTGCKNFAGAEGVQQLRFIPGSCTLPCRYGSQWFVRGTPWRGRNARQGSPRFLRRLP